MSISDVHPHDARMTELRSLAVIVLLGLFLIGFILWSGMGEPNLTFPALLQPLKGVSPIAIPLALTVAVGMTAVVTKSNLFEQSLGVTGYTPGETGFIVIGIWMGTALAMSLIIGGHQSRTPQELVFYLSGSGTVLFGLLVVMTRNYR